MTASAAAHDVLDALAVEFGSMLAHDSATDYDAETGPAAARVWLEGLDLADVLAPLLEEAAAAGWDEGYQRGLRDADLQHEADNPHRARREDAHNPWGDDHLTPVRLRPATEDEL